MAVWREKEGDGRQLFGEYYFPDRSCPSAPHWAQGPETRSVRNRRGFLRAHWGGARGPLWTPLGRFSYALVAPVAFERPSAASFGREHARGLCPQYPPYNRNVAIYKIEPIRFSKGASLQQLVSNPGFPHAASSSREGCSKGSSKEPQGHPKEFLVPLLAAILFWETLGGASGRP